MRRYAEEHQLPMHIDSAGTGSWHIGHPADPRSIREGERRGARMEMTARQVHATDFEDFDLLVAMDRMNVADLVDWPGSNPRRIRLLRSFDPAADGDEVPDPYYGTARDFQRVGDMIEAALPGLADHLAAISRQRR